MANCKPFYTSLPKNLKLTLNMGSLDTDANTYCRLVGKSLYYTIIRLDIQYTTSIVSRFILNPSRAISKQPYTSSDTSNSP
jgi:hypothetical protein